MKQNAPKPVPRSATAIARPRARGYHNAAIDMLAWLPNAARPRPPITPYTATSATREWTRLASARAAAATSAPDCTRSRGPSRSKAQPDQGAADASHEEYGGLHGGHLRARSAEFGDQRQVDHGERHDHAVLDGERDGRDGEGARGHAPLGGTQGAITPAGR